MTNRASAASRRRNSDEAKGPSQCRAPAEGPTRAEERPTTSATVVTVIVATAADGRREENRLSQPASTGPMISATPIMEASSDIAVFRVALVVALCQTARIMTATGGALAPTAAASVQMSVASAPLRTAAIRAITVVRWAARQLSRAVRAGMRSTSRPRNGAVRPWPRVEQLTASPAVPYEWELPTRSSRLRLVMLAPSFDVMPMVAIRQKPGTHISVRWSAKSRCGARRPDSEASGTVRDRLTAAVSGCGALRRTR
ncbi:hypothetical protein GCM10010299_44040 [Streptomyces tanashiensis]|nr:hypothetical protein GCM10010299_44040 [Streptomyces tanashiensis]